MSKRIKLLLVIQQSIAFVFFPLLFFVLWIWMTKIQRYTMDDLTAIRQQYRQLTDGINEPLLICPNHLTFIDSLVITWALSSPWNYFFHFKQFAWNLPKQSHVAESRLYQVICYLSKCLLIDSDSNKAKATMAIAQQLLLQGNHIMVFPEGRRSKTGRINTENFVYGVGGIIRDLPSVKVLMVYMRGASQTERTKMPARKEHFNLAMKIIKPTTDKKGLRAQRDLARQLIDALCQMEEEHFARHPR